MFIEEFEIHRLETVRNMFSDFDNVGRLTNLEFYETSESHFRTLAPRYSLHQCLTSVFKFKLNTNVS